MKESIGPFVGYQSERFRWLSMHSILEKCDQKEDVLLKWH